LAFAPALITPSATTALTLAEAKAHLRLDHEDEDALVTSLIATAQAHLDGPEGILSRVLMDSEWSEIFEDADCKLKELGHHPVTSISSITVDGAALAAANYSLRYRDTGMAVVIFDTAQSGEIEIRYRAGALSATEVPEPLKHAMKLHIGSLYEMREMEAVAVIVSKLPHYDILVEPYRRRRIGR